MHAWHNALFAIVATLPGIVYTDVDEVNNAVSIGVADQPTLNAVQNAVRSLGLPANAVQVPIVPRVSSAPGNVTSHSLDPNDPPQDSDNPSAITIRSKVRPAIGGLEINNAQGFCTLGFNTQKVKFASTGSYVYDNTHYFVTAAHCMNSPGLATGTIISQGGWGTSTLYYLGQERRQPPWGTNYQQCPSGYRCSLADAALVAYTYDDGDMAMIARTNGGANSGRLDFDPLIPRFVIRDSSAFNNQAIAGTPISKIGATSGWTSGYTRGTCSNFPSDVMIGYYLVCQDTHTAAADAGDSGAPVFSIGLDGRSVRMIGIHWGGTGSFAIFSSYVYVKAELTEVDRAAICGSEPNCWLGLNVSGLWR